MRPVSTPASIRRFAFTLDNPHGGRHNAVAHLDGGGPMSRMPNGIAAEFRALRGWFPALAMASPASADVVVKQKTVFELVFAQIREMWARCR
jgi:hypothetical protein